MGDGHHGAGKALQEDLQPLHALGVQVVGGLVQQQHVGLGQQQLAQRHAALLAARELADHGVPWRQAQRVGGDLELVLAVGAGGGDHGFEPALLLAQGVEVGIGFGVGGVDFFQPGLGRVDLAHGQLDFLTHGVLGVELRLLRQVADVQAGHRRGLALDLLVDASHDLEQRGLARAVQAQHADLGAREEAERDVLQDLPLGRHDLADAVHGEDVLGHAETSPITLELIAACARHERAGRRFGLKLRQLAKALGTPHRGACGWFDYPCLSSPQRARAAFRRRAEARRLRPGRPPW